MNSLVINEKKFDLDSAKWDKRSKADCPDSGRYNEVRSTCGGEKGPFYDDSCGKCRNNLTQHCCKHVVCGRKP